MISRTTCECCRNTLHLVWYITNTFCLRYITNTFCLRYITNTFCLRYITNTFCLRYLIWTCYEYIRLMYILRVHFVWDILRIHFVWDTTRIHFVWHIWYRHSTNTFCLMYITNTLCLRYVRNIFCLTYILRMHFVWCILRIHCTCCIPQKPHSMIFWHHFEGHVWYRVVKTQRMPYLYRSFSTKEPYNHWLFCGKSLASEGILCIFAALYTYMPECNDVIRLEFRKIAL